MALETVDCSQTLRNTGSGAKPFLLSTYCVPGLLCVRPWRALWPGLRRWWRPTVDKWVPGRGKWGGWLEGLGGGAGSLGPRLGRCLSS